MSDKHTLHEFDHDFGRFVIEDQGGATLLRQVGGKKVDLHHGLDGYILLHEVLRLAAENDRLRALLVEAAECEVLDGEGTMRVIDMEASLWNQIRELRGGESDGR